MLIVFGSILLHSVLLGIFNSFFMALLISTLFGLLPLFNITVNAITFTNSIVAVGITTEFFINMIRALAQRKKGVYSPDDFPLFGSIFTSLTFSAISACVGLILLSFADTPLISVYFFVVYFLIIILAYFFAILVIPAFLLLLFRISSSKSQSKITSNNLEEEENELLDYEQSRDGDGEDEDGGEGVVNKEDEQVNIVWENDGDNFEEEEEEEILSK